MPIDGTENDDQIFGTPNDDVIHGLGGNDHIEGGDGDDDISGGDGDDVIDGGSGIDSLYGGAGNDIIYGGVGARPDSIWAGDNLSGGDGNDLLVVNPEDQHGNIYFVDGGAGSDTLVIDGTHGVNLSLGFHDIAQSQSVGTDLEITLYMSGIENVSGSFSDDYLFGDENANIIEGRDGYDYIDGSAGDDTIYGGAGNDTLNGGDGSDVVYGGDGYDYIEGWADGANDTYDGGADYDTVSYWAAAAAVSVDFNRASGQAQSLSGTSALIGVDTLVSIEVVIGSQYGDRLVAATGSFARFEGGAGDDTLIGGDVRDELLGGEGNDRIEGGGGDDYILGDDGNDIMFGGDGNDEIYAGSGADSAQGGAGNDLLEISAGGNDIFNGSSGSDTVEFASGDTIHVDLRLQGISQEIQSGWSVTLSGVENVWGSFGDDVIIGDAANNIIDGRDGVDVMRGGLGNDTYYVGYQGDVIIENPGEGIDTVYTQGVQQPDWSYAYTLPDNVENGSSAGEGVMTFHGNAMANTIYVSSGSLYGEGGNDRLYGGFWSNILDGGSGSDLMWGGAGDDHYYVDSAADRTIEYADEGVDTVFASVNFALGANVERLDLIGTALIGRGNGLNNGLFANDLGNSLLGYAGDDSLFGGSGNDWLNGGTGADYMKGGQGDDVYFVDNSGDIVSEYVGEGTDTVYSTVSFNAQYLPLEKLILTGAADVDLIGNELDNVMMGNAGSNILNGWQGADRLFGQGGVDTLYGGLGNDWIQGGQGTDHLYGGEGADQFVFDDGEFGGRARGNGDVIHEFSHAEGDKIRLSLADANTNTAEDDAFTFIGTNAFSGQAGELRISTYLSDLIVTGDVNGDGVADFLIIVSNTSSLLASDFIL